MRRIGYLTLFILLIVCLFFFTSCKTTSSADWADGRIEETSRKDGYLICPDGSVSSLHYSQLDKWSSERGWAVLDGDKEKEAYYTDLLQNWAKQYCD